MRLWRAVVASWSAKALNHLAAATRIPHRGQPLTPAWAAVCDGGIKGLPLIEGVSELILLVDHDRNGVGQAAAKACDSAGGRPAARSLQLMPNEPGMGFQRCNNARRYAWIMNKKTKTSPTPSARLSRGSATTSTATQRGLDKI